MEHAYGLYTHIQANKRRSIALLIGLFFLVYVMVFAGALAAEALTGSSPARGTTSSSRCHGRHWAPGRGSPSPTSSTSR
jgi:hypothetical protein